MKISVNWLKDYLPGVPEIGKLTDMLTFAGVEVEGVETKGADIANVVVARILKSDKHPDADRLSVVEVDDGSGTPRQIVCGAKNYKVQDCVPLALPGAVLPGDFKIKDGKLRGVKSDGMLCSGKELGLGEESAGLLILPPDAIPGTPIGKLFPGDTIVEVEVTPNRPDLLSHCGLAREAGTLTGLDVRFPESHPPAPAKLAKVPISITATKLCPLYTARRIKGVRVGASPAWLKTRLESVGLRPINNIVDITNYVMIELGHPLHAFDADKLKGGIVVRLSRPDEQLLALDGKTYGLSGDALVIADSSRPIALAGIMGGEETGVSAGTTEIILESAWFKPSQIRRTSRALGLSSDSSYRFERGVDPAGARAASDRAAQLILEIAGGEAGPLEESAAPELDAIISTWRVSLRYERCRRLLGAEIENARIDELLSRLGLAKAGGDSAKSEWTIPTFRRDLTREVDLIEEVMRVAGMTAVEPRTNGYFSAASPADREHDLRMKIARCLEAAGWSEIRTMALVSRAALETDIFGNSAAIALRNPMNEDHAALRASLIPGLFTVADTNMRQGTRLLRLFECGAVYSSDGESTQSIAMLMTGRDATAGWRSTDERTLDLFDLKGALALLGPVKFKRRADASNPLDLDVEIDGKPIGRVAQISVSRAKALSARDAVFVAELQLAPLLAFADRTLRYQAVAKFPAVTRDIALVGPRDVTHEQIVSVLADAGGELLESAQLFDVFTDDTGVKLGADMRSLAYALAYRAPDRTLTEADVNSVHTALLEKVTTTLPLKLRA